MGREIAARDRPGGSHGITYYESPDDPDLLIDIVDWELPEARTVHLAAAAASGAYAPILKLVGGPVRATVTAGCPDPSPDRDRAPVTAIASWGPRGSALQLASGR